MKKLNIQDFVKMNECCISAEEQSILNYKLDNHKEIAFETVKKLLVNKVEAIRIAEENPENTVIVSHPTNNKQYPFKINSALIICNLHFFVDTTSEKVKIYPLNFDFNNKKSTGRIHVLVFSDSAYFTVFSDEIVYFFLYNLELDKTYFEWRHNEFLEHSNKDTFDDSLHKSQNLANIKQQLLLKMEADLVNKP